MRKILTPVLLALGLFGFGNIALALPATLNAEDQKLVLNGEGVRSMLLIDLYKGGLYLKAKQKNANGNAIASANEHMAIRMEVTSGLITEEKLTEVVRDGFEASTGSKTAMKKEIDQLIGSFAKDIKKGDVGNLIYVPGKGTIVYKNGNKGAVIPGLAFKKALFGIWLGDKPAQKSLKKAMLGQ